VYVQTKPYKSKNDFLSERWVYKCLTCSTCLLKPECTKGNRQMQVGFELRLYRQQAKDTLLSEQGLALCQQRSIESETIFGDIKHKMGVRRFMLCRLKKVDVEWGLVCTAYNLRKLAIQ